MDFRTGEKGINIIIGITIALILGVTILFIQNQSEKKAVLQKGETVSATILNKKQVKDTETKELTAVPMGGSSMYMLPSDSLGVVSKRPNKTQYTFTIKTNGKQYTIVSSKNVYHSKSIGDSLKIIVYKDKIAIAEENQ